MRVCFKELEGWNTECIWCGEFVVSPGRVGCECFEGTIEGRFKGRNGVVKGVGSNPHSDFFYGAKEAEFEETIILGCIFSRCCWKTKGMGKREE